MWQIESTCFLLLPSPRLRSACSALQAALSLKATGLAESVDMCLSQSALEPFMLTQDGVYIKHLLQGWSAGHLSSSYGI